MNNNRLIVVLGMHRSGTSALARSLQVMEGDLGNNLMPAVPGNNAKGFWEDRDFNKLNIDILNEIRSDWHYVSRIREGDIRILCEKEYLSRSIELLRQKVDHAKGIFCFKDPRATKLLPFWKRVFSVSNLQVSYVVAIRNPLSVVKSLEKRDGFHATKSYLLWLTHVLTILSEIDGEQSVVMVDYDRLMYSPEKELYRIADRLDLNIEENALEEYKNNFLDDALRNTVHNLDELSSDDACPPLVGEAYTLLLDLASDTAGLNDPFIRSNIIHLTSEFDRIEVLLELIDKQTVEMAVAFQAITESKNQISELKKNIDESSATISTHKNTIIQQAALISTLNETIETKDKCIEAKDNHLNRILSSRTWRYTRPIREISNFVRNISSSKKK